MRERILIADDETEILSVLKLYLEQEGYEVLAAVDGNEALAFIEHKPDLIILDINMPGLDGLSLCGAIRGMVDCPILFLTARVDEADRVLGFSVGADDYVVKPFGLVELGARIKAHLRRESRKANLSNRRSFGRLWIDFTTGNVGFENKTIELARKEYEIIKLLSLHPGQVFSRERIYENIWGIEAEGDDSAVTEHIKRLRQKLGAYGQSERIETVWGVGYRWRRG